MGKARKWTIAAAAVWALLGASAASANQLSFSGPTTASPGQSIALQIGIDEADLLVSYDFTVVYVPTVLSFTSASAPAGTLTPTPDPGLLGLSWFTISALGPGPAKLADLEFQVVNDASLIGTSTTLAFDFPFGDGTLGFDLNGGQTSAATGAPFVLRIVGAAPPNSVPEPSSLFLVALSLFLAPAGRLWRARNGAPAA